jgi:hypothetical protein
MLLRSDDMQLGIEISSPQILAPPPPFVVPCRLQISLAIERL